MNSSGTLWDRRTDGSVTAVQQTAHLSPMQYQQPWFKAVYTYHSRMI